MKKFLTMFAFAAAIVFGAFTLASCGDDEDGPNATHKFTLDATMSSNLASVRESEDFKADNAALSDEIRKQFRDKGLEATMTDSQAGLLWSQIRGDAQTNERVQKFLDMIAAGYKDRTLTLTLIYKRDGDNWRSDVWTTTYKDEWYK